ncbi:hypothetical protein GALL_485660 [mine drainage metagenome]|uniref:Uncharacterized protein n=1 Tax=mine drainage metagenome TaxID=410659 RepID=A0A1J5PQH7_9ZZZZ
MVIGDRTQSTSGDGFLEKKRQQPDQYGRDHGGVQVFRIDHEAAIKHVLKRQKGVLGHTDVNAVNVTAKQGLPNTVQKIADAQGGHQQGGSFLVDQMTQCQTLNQPRHDKHDGTGTDKSQQIDGHLVVQAGVQRQPFGKARHRQGRKQHHGTLGEIEHARGFVNQHKTQRHQGIQHARHQAAQQCFNEKSHANKPPLLLACFA